MANRKAVPAEGLDETRRLLYMALLRPRTGKYELAGSLVNALAHHHPDGTSAEEIADHVVNVIEGADAPDGLGPQTGSREWLAGQIRRITEELGEGTT